jgi:DNA-binding transcriptional MerR regulator
VGFTLAEIRNLLECWRFQNVQGICKYDIPLKEKLNLIFARIDKMIKIIGLKLWTIK